MEALTKNLTNYTDLLGPVGQNTERDVACLADVITRIINGHPNNQINELLL